MCDYQDLFSAVRSVRPQQWNEMWLCVCYVERVSAGTCSHQRAMAECEQATRWQLSAQCFISFFNSILFGVRHFQHANSPNHSSLRHRLRSGSTKFFFFSFFTPTLTQPPPSSSLFFLFRVVCFFFSSCSVCSVLVVIFAKFTCVSFSGTAV